MLSKPMRIVAEMFKVFVLTSTSGTKGLALALALAWLGRSTAGGVAISV